ncbi:MAG: hypothetical protein E3J72_04810 [Planctomycetota bacterium]|nr:MAG: hypothetical protein E3J72_04810 [Planctomycetota bacterium]
MGCEAKGFYNTSACRRSDGVTLIETVIAVVLFSFIIMAIYAIDRSAKNTYDVGTGQQDMQRISSRLLNQISSAFIQGRMTFANESSLTLQVPVDHDDDDDVLDDNYMIEWGAVDKDGVVQRGYSVSYAFVPAASGKTYSESALDIDFNEDGDKSDTFALGAIHKQWLDVSGTMAGSSPISTDKVLFEAGSPIFARIDDTGTADAAGKNIRIFFIVVFEDRRNNVYHRAVRTTAAPRNPIE